MSTETRNDDIRDVLALRKYELIRVLGVGGFAQVFLCRDLNNKVDVVCKVVRKNEVDQEWRKSYMVQEAEIASKFRHPHIVQVVSAFQTRRFMFTFLELMSGGELSDRIYREVKVQTDGKEITGFKKLVIEINQLVTWFSHIASALQYIHLKGYAHRDMKPQNVLLDKYDNAKLSDFGFLTRIRDSNGKLSSTNCGSWEYQAPEVSSGLYDASLADVWALGQTVYEMLFIHRPSSPPIAINLYD